MDPEVFFLLRCGECMGLFAMCARHYCGQSLCGPDCKRASRRRAHRKHRHSEEGRADHRDRNRAHRQRRLAARRVMDVPSSNLPFGDISCPRGDEPGSTEDTEHRVAGSKHDDTREPVGDDGPESAHDADLDDGRAGRADAGGAGSDGAGPPARGGDASGGPCALAPADAHRCRVCRRQGEFFRPAPLRRARRGGAQPSLRGLGRAPRPPRGPPPLMPGPLR